MLIFCIDGVPFHQHHLIGAVRVGFEDTEHALRSMSPGDFSQKDFNDTRGRLAIPESGSAPCFSPSRQNILRRLADFRRIRSHKQIRAFRDRYRALSVLAERETGNS